MQQDIEKTREFNEFKAQMLQRVKAHLDLIHECELEIFECYKLLGEVEADYMEPADKEEEAMVIYLSDRKPKPGIAWMPNY